MPGQMNFSRCAACSWRGAIAALERSLRCRRGMGRKKLNYCCFWRLCSKKRAQERERELLSFASMLQCGIYAVRLYSSLLFFAYKRVA